MSDNPFEVKVNDEPVDDVNSTETNGTQELETHHFDQEHPDLEHQLHNQLQDGALNSGFEIPPLSAGFETLPTQQKYPQQEFIPPVKSIDQSINDAIQSIDEFVQGDYPGLSEDERVIEELNENQNIHEDRENHDGSNAQPEFNIEDVHEEGDSNNDIMEVDQPELALNNEEAHEVAEDGAIQEDTPQSIEHEEPIQIDSGDNIQTGQSENFSNFQTEQPEDSNNIQPEHQPHFQGNQHEQQAVSINIQQDQEYIPESHIVEEEANTTALGIQIPQQFATPSKSLPALKDIDIISTPKSFNVAKDFDQENDKDESSFHSILPTFSTFSTLSSDSKSAISSFLSLDESVLNNLPIKLLHALEAKSSEYQSLVAETSFLQLKNEQNAQTSTKLASELKSKLSKSTEQASKLETELKSLQKTTSATEELVTGLSESNRNLTSKLESKAAVEEKLRLEIAQLEEEYDLKVVKLGESANEYIHQNIEQSTRINEITKELNNATNDAFTVKLNLTKVNNEVSYLKDQKAWYESELSTVQARYTDLIKRHESEHLLTSNKLSSLSATNESLKTTNAANSAIISELREKLQAESEKSATLSRDFSNERGNLLQQIQNQADLITLTKSQVTQRSERIAQLESYSSELKKSLGGSVESLEQSLATKNERLVELEEKLLRTEAVLDKELHRESKENDLPRLTSSSTLIAAQGISLSTLYSEFNHLKKQVVMERSQKEKLSLQLESFVHELESKKPAIANYRDQVAFYEKSLQEMVVTIESVRVEKANAEKDSKRLRARISENENDLVSMKRLLKDVGRQLCYYLIHSKIRDGNEDPLSISEKKAIESILEKTGNFDEETTETDSDKLVTERLLEFKNIIELRKKNEELLKVVRLLTKQLEEGERSSVESVAIEEAKDAILTLEGEVERLGGRLEAVTKERDILREVTDVEDDSKVSTVVTTSTSKNSINLLNQLNQNEAELRELQASSSAALAELNKKLHAATNAKNEISIKLSSSIHTAELAESRFQNAQSSLSLLRTEIDQVQQNLKFWQEQASKQESLLISKSNELRGVEAVVSQNRITISNLEASQSYGASIQKSLRDEALQLKQDKNNLNEFVVNLQSLLKQRDESSKEVSARLDKSIENYQALQDRLNEKDERISILTSQAELTLKAQNSKLEQIGEVSKNLLDTKTKLAETERTVAALNSKIKELNIELVNRSSGGAEEKQDLFEINQLKQDLQIAEGQVAELQTLSSAGEEALRNAANSFDRHKQDLNGKLESLLEEKSSLVKQVEALQSAVATGKKELDEANKLHLLQINELQTKMDGYYNKANAYDKLQQDYESRLTSVRADFEAQAQLAKDTQIKYHSELTKNNELSQSVVSSQDEIEKYKEKLQISHNELQEVLSKEESLYQDRTSLEDELNSVRAQVAELKEQNVIVLNQLELGSSINQSSERASEEDSEENLKEVLAYLRREKESAEVKLSVKNNEFDLLNQKLTQATAELNRLQAESSSGRITKDLSVSQSVAENHKLSEQLESLNILRESNTTLRSESNERLQRIQKLEVQLQAISAQLEPLKSRNSSLETEIEVTQQRVKLIDEENSRLKARLEKSGRDLKDKEREIREAASAASGLSTPLPAGNEGEASPDVAHEAAQGEAQTNQATNEANASAESALAAEQIAQMKEKYNDLRNKANTRIQSQNDRIKESQEMVASLTEEINSLKSSSSKQETETTKKLRDQISKLTQEKNALVAQLAQLKKSGEASAEQITKLESEIARIKQETAKEKHNLEERLKKVEAKGPNTPAGAPDAAEITKLKEGFNKTLETEREQVKKRVEKLYDMKMKMLNKKVERLEKEAKKKGGKGPNTPTPGNGAAAGTPANAPANSTNSQNQANVANAATPANPFTVPAGLPAIPGFGTAQLSAPSASTATPDATAAPSNAPGKLGYPFTESTLTVHRPGESEEVSGQKRPNDTKAATNGNGNANRKRAKE